MLSEQDLLQLFMQQNIPLEGRKVVETIRTSDPGRRVKSGTHNVAARFASRKMGMVIQAESHKNELPAIYLWEHDERTHEFYDQPAAQVKLSYLNAVGRRSTHLSTPDFFLIQEDWMGWVECKQEEWLWEQHATGSKRFEPDGNGGWRCPPGEEFAAQYGLGFKIRSSRENNWTLVRNFEFLSEYLHPSCPAPAEDAVLRIRELFAGERWMPLRDVLWQDGVDANAVYKLIADGGLHIDLDNELLTQRNYTQVCRDAESADIYVRQKRGRSNVPAIVVPRIELVTGARIVWDGKPWQIVNVGASDIFLADDGKDIVNFAIDKFRSMVACGQITGLHVPSDDGPRLAEEMLKHAAPIDLQQASRRSACLEAAALGEPVYQVSPRTLRYWKSRAAHGEASLGNRYVGLLPRVSARGNRTRKVSQAVIDAMNEVIDREVLKETKSNILACYGFLVNACRERGYVCPSEKTFRNEIARRRLDLKILAREGRKAAYAVTEFYWVIDQSTPRHGERPFEVGHIDHTELDVELVDGESGANLGRPWLTVLVDAFSRMILAYFLTFDPPSYRSCMAVIQECVRRHGRIPRTIVTDQGSEFESVYFEALLARLESHKKSRPAAKARFGSVIERFFGVANQTFIHNLAGNSQALQRPRSMSPSHDPRTLAVWTLSALMDEFERYADENYAKWRHGTLGMPPRDAMARGLALTGNRPHLLIPFTQDFRFICLPSTPAGRARIRAGRGVKIRGIHYWHPAFREVGANTSVPVRYDPFDISKAYALVGGKWLLCRSEYQSLLEGRTEREISIISQEIRALHIQRGIHRQVKAAQIASFLEGARGTEAVLRQQRRDAQRLPNGQASAPEPQPPYPLPDESRDHQENPWAAHIEVEIFGELQ